MFATSSSCDEVEFLTNRDSIIDLTSIVDNDNVEGRNPDSSFFIYNIVSDPYQNGCDGSQTQVRFNQLVTQFESMVGLVDF